MQSDWLINMMQNVMLLQFAEHFRIQFFIVPVIYNLPFQGSTSVAASQSKLHVAMSVCKWHPAIWAI